MAPEIAIIVLGITGAGKSTFVNSVMNRTGEQVIGVSHGLKSFTKDLSEELIPNRNGSQFHGYSVFIVDTPGFDDTSLPDVVVWKKIITWLNESRANKPKRHFGAIYLTSIKDSRIPVAEKQNLDRFCQFFGSNGWKKVVLTSTKWSDAGSDATSRHAELENGLWNTMIKDGSQTVGFKGDHADALKIIGRVVTRIHENKEGIAVGDSSEKIIEILEREERERQPSNIFAKLSSYFRRTFATIFSLKS